MGLSSLLFRDTFEVNADYETIVSSFKEKLDRNFFKGYIDRDETQLFYFSGFFRRPLSTNLPVIQLNFENKADDKGKIKIKFKLVDFAIILFGIANGMILFFSLFSLNPNRPTDVIPSEIPVIFLIFSYGLLLSIYLIELTRFKGKLKEFESR